MQQRPQQGRRRAILVSLCCALLLLLATTVALLAQAQQQTRADDDDLGNIVGPPTLPAAMVDAIFAQQGSPMAGTGAVVEATARAANIDDAFALAIWEIETSDGAAGVGYSDRNPGGVRSSPGYPGDAGGYAIYPSYAAAIVDWFNVLKSRYVDRGLTSVYTLCYPYVGTSSAPQWANKVVNLMVRYQGEVPPPTPTPTLSPVYLAHKAIALQPAAQQQTPVQRAQPMQGQQIEGRKSRATSSPQTPGTQAALPRPITLLLVLLGLLAALLIALWSKWGIGGMPLPATRQTSIDEPVLRTTSALLEPLPFQPSLFVNQFSPIRETSPLGERHTDALTEALTEAMNALPTMQPRVRRVILQPVPVPVPRNIEDEITVKRVAVSREQSTRQGLVGLYGGEAPREFSSHKRP
jgi:hypothetical protein